MLTAARFLLLLCVTSAAAAPDQAPRLVAGPAAERAGRGVVIRFAVSRETDAEVAIVDAEGRVVRHLAAGRLGRNAPKPFRAGSLTQTLSWNGTDDAGKPVGDLSKLRVRVGLGLEGELHKVIGWNGDYHEAVRGIACGPDGTLYVLYGGGLYAHRTTSLISAFDRDGRYLRQVYPGPAGLPPE